MFIDQKVPASLILNLPCLLPMTQLLFTSGTKPQLPQTFTILKNIIAFHLLHCLLHV